MFSLGSSKTARQLNCFGFVIFVKRYQQDKNVSVVCIVKHYGLKCLSQEFGVNFVRISTHLTNSAIVHLRTTYLHCKDGL